MTKKSSFRTNPNGLQHIIPTYHIEADGRGGSLFLTVSGVKGIKEFSSGEVIIAAKREFIRIRGELLEISVFEYGSIGISGRIESISFEQRKRGIKNEA